MPGLVREGVAPDDRLVRLNRVAGQTRDDPRGASDLLGDGARVQAELSLTRGDQHDDLLERRVAGALADAVDRALDLAGAGHQAGDRVGDGQTEVVVAVDRQHHVAQLRDELIEPRQKSRVLVRHRVADGVGDVDRGGTLVERDLQHLSGELDVGASRIHRRELDVVAVRLGVRDGRPRHPLTSSRVFCIWYLMWMSEVEMKVWIRGRSASFSAPQAASIHPEKARARPAITGPSTVRAIPSTASKSPGEAIGKPASITSTPSRASCWAISSFSCGVQRDARRLLAVAQRRVEDDYSVGVLRWRH